MSIHKKRVTQKSRFQRNQLYRIISTKFIKYLKDFYKADLGINKLLHLESHSKIEISEKSILSSQPICFFKKLMTFEQSFKTSS